MINYLMKVITCYCILNLLFHLYIVIDLFMYFSFRLMNFKKYLHSLEESIEKW